MTGLLKDPDGTSVFDRNEVNIADHTSPTNKEMEELKDLRNKVQQFETQMVKQ